MTAQPGPAPDLAADLNALLTTSPRVGGRCAVGAVLAALPKKERDALVAILVNPAVAGSQVSRVLVDHGHRVAASSIQRHRRRVDGSGCTCPA